LSPVFNRVSEDLTRRSQMMAETASAE